MMLVVCFLLYSVIEFTLSEHAPSDKTVTPDSSFTSDLNSKVLGYHAVPGCQISVDKLVGVEVSHTISNLPCHLKHLLQRRER